MKNKYVLKDQVFHIRVELNQKYYDTAPYIKVWRVNGMRVQFEVVDDFSMSSSGIKVHKSEKRDFKLAVKAAVAIGNIEDQWVNIGVFLKNIIKSLKKRV